MKNLPLTLATALGLSALLSGCGKKSDSAPPVTAVSVTASATRVLANGSNSVTLHVSTTGGGPVSVSTTLGAFSNGQQSATVAGASGDLQLVTCDSRSSSSCRGVAAIRAVDAGFGSGSASVTFATLADCSTDCGLDAAACADRACTSPTVSGGMCVAGACAPLPVVTVAAARASVVANHLNTVSLSISTTGRGPISLSTSRGTLDVATIAGASGTAVLTTCDSAAVATCAGDAVVTATDGSGTAGSGHVTFVALSACSSDCSVDAAACAGRACSSPAVSAGTCSSGACVPPPVLTVTPTRSSVLANGTNAVDLAVSSTGTGPITVTTTRGSLSSGTIAGSSGTVTLTTCNSTSSATCAGTAQVTAMDGAGSGSAQIQFAALSACASNCALDSAACAGQSCTSASVAGGICAAGACTAPPVVTVTPAAASVAANGTNTVNVAISTTGSGPIGVTTSRGTLDTPTIAGASGTVVLTTCDSIASATCAGSAVITATDAAHSVGTGTVAFEDMATGAAITVTPGRTRVPADGVATTPITVRVTRRGVATAGVAVGLATDLGSLSAPTATTDVNGNATVTFTAPAAAGIATITATMTGVAGVTASATVTMPALGLIQIGTGGVQYPVMGVRGSGYREINAISVAVLDDQNKAYPDGLVLHFEHVQLGGSTLGGTPPNVPPATCAVPAGCVAYDGRTDAAGIARVNLGSGSVAGTLLVTASATAAGVTRTFTVPNVAVIGAKANGANFSIVCSPRNVPALAETDCSTSLVDAQFTCAALLKDRFNNLLGTQTQVTFVAEAAAVGQVATTPAYDPTKGPTEQASLGVATQVFRTLGAGLPFDVPPVAGEPSVLHNLDNCGVRTHNPRDGVLTVIAIADGEEAFFDANGDGVYTPGEPFIDLGEPFVDQNDNGVWDPGEWFLDVNQNGVYDGPNGVWDGTAKIWTQTVVIYTGAPAGPLVATGGSLGLRWADGTFVNSCTPSAVSAPFSVNAPVTGPPAIPATTQRRYVAASDLNLNLLTSSTVYSVGVLSPGKVAAAYRGQASYADDLGLFFQYWPCDQSGACASQCRATGTNLPCVMRPSIGSFGCGLSSFVDITGVSPADGTNIVEWKASTTYPVYLNPTKRVDVVTDLTGTNN